MFKTRYVNYIPSVVTVFRALHVQILPQAFCTIKLQWWPSRHAFFQLPQLGMQDLTNLLISGSNFYFGEGKQVVGNQAIALHPLCYFRKLMPRGSQEY